jgi:hypoxanthine-guanine phosphoribosyltransferase
MKQKIYYTSRNKFIVGFGIELQIYWNKLSLVTDQRL